MLERLTTGGPKRILALDGGGIRRALTLGYLPRFEAILANGTTGPTSACATTSTSSAARAPARSSRPLWRSASTRRQDRAGGRLVAQWKQEPPGGAEGGLALQPGVPGRPLHRPRPRRDGDPHGGADPQVGARSREHRGRQARRPSRDRRDRRRSVRVAGASAGDLGAPRADQRRRPLRVPGADGPARGRGPDRARRGRGAAAVPRPGGRPGGGRRGPAGHGHERADRGAPRHPEARARAGAPARHPGAPARLPPDARESVVWTLALDETRDTGLELRPRLPYSGPRDFTGPEPFSRRAARAAASARLSDILKPIALDPLTVVDDGDFLDQVAAQPKVPQAVREGLRDFY